LAQKIDVEVNDNLDPAAFTPALATAVLSDGTRFEVSILAQLGSPALPLTFDQHLTKARACMAFAGMADRHQALTDAVMTLTESTNVSGDLQSALYPQA
jgi:hypothetical protein